MGINVRALSIRQTRGARWGYVSPGCYLGLMLGVCRRCRMDLPYGSKRCAVCESGLCQDCAAKGCCGNTPALLEDAGGEKKREGAFGRGVRTFFPRYDPPSRPHGDAPPVYFAGRCCEQAEQIPCSCHVHWKCPAHGDRGHIGSTE